MYEFCKSKNLYVAGIESMGTVGAGRLPHWYAEASSKFGVRDSTTSSASRNVATNS